MAKKKDRLGEIVQSLERIDRLNLEGMKLESKASQRYALMLEEWAYILKLVEELQRAD